MLSGRQIAINLMLTFVACLIVSICIGLAAKNVQLQERAYVDNEMLDKKFTTIYESLEVIADRHRVIADTQLRTQHYSKPHTSFQDLCPECGDLWGKQKKDVVFVPVGRLAELRQAERDKLGNVLAPPSAEEGDEPPIDIEEELDSVIHLLKSHESYSYTLMQTETYTNHYAKKHDHPVPGVLGFGNCPDCIALRNKQTTQTQPISKTRYDHLLRIEKGAQSNER